MKNLKKLIMVAVFFSLGIFHNNIVSAVFNDTQGHLYQEAIQYVQDKGIVQGYEDGTYRPDQTINRAEFTKILILTVLGEPPPAAADCFSDVQTDKWFAGYVCRAKTSNIISGYLDGSFGPEKNINFVESAKILVNAFGFPTATVGSDEEWYTPFVTTLADQKAIPNTITRTDSLITRGEMAEMIMRLKEKDTSKPSLQRCDFISPFCPGDGLSGFGDELLANVDMKKVRETWLDWYNTERATLGRDPYTYNTRLNRSAYLWSKFSRDRGYMDHKRPGQTAYYDYNIIAQWFKDLGLVFENINRVTFSENIGWGPYSCSMSDCTETLTQNIRSTFDFYMAEKGAAYAPHYNSLTNRYFKEIGLGISVDENTHRYYLTVHYGTRIL